MKISRQYTERRGINKTFWTIYVFDDGYRLELTKDGWSNETRLINEFGDRVAVRRNGCGMCMSGYHENAGFKNGNRILYLKEAYKVDTEYLVQIGDNIDEIIKENES